MLEGEGEEIVRTSGDCSERGQGCADEQAKSCSQGRERREVDEQDQLPRVDGTTARERARKMQNSQEHKD